MPVVSVRNRNFESSASEDEMQFCGPATTVEIHCITTSQLAIRTLGEGVSETGERVAVLALFPQQVDILNQSPPRVFLTGPPGTGKTVVLMLIALSWLYHGHSVHVVSTWNQSRAASILIEHFLKETMRTTTASSRVHSYQFDLMKDGEVGNAVRCLESLSEMGQLCVIADEVVYSKQKLTEFCEQLILQVSLVYLWCASVHHGVRPFYLNEFKLTAPLRSPPVVVRQVMEARKIKSKRVHYYTVNEVPVPTDGPAVIEIKHRGRESRHTGKWPYDCVECGHQVARVLTELNVGLTGDNKGPPPLQYRDVLVLCLDYPSDDLVDREGRVISTASGLVWGLRASHVPVCVVEKCDEAAIRDMALGVGNLVKVAHWCDVLGLERKVVVVENRRLYSLQRLYAMSRCTSQLVLLDC